MTTQNDRAGCSAHPATWRTKNKSVKGTGRNLFRQARPVAVCLCLWLQITIRSGAAEMRVLKGHVPAVTASITAAGRLPSSTRLNLAIGLPLRNQAALDTLLQQIYDPTSLEYRHYLTSAQFTARFGATAEDYQAVMAFAQTNGLTVTATHPNRMIVDVSASAATIEKAFHLTMRLYPHPSEHRMFYAPDVEPKVQANLPVLHISGFDNYVLPRPMSRPASQRSRAQQVPNSGSAPDGFSYIGNDFRAAYVPDTLCRGTGQTVGLLQLNSGFYQSDITTYESLAGLPNVPVITVLLDGYGGGPGKANEEVSLDIEMAISMAPGLSSVVVYEGSTPNDLLSEMAAPKKGEPFSRQLSSSWTFPTDATTSQIFQEFAAQGQSFFNASGDSDAYPGNTIIPPPCDSPFITIVGGTELTTTGPGGGYLAEAVWNNGYDQTTGRYWGSGGGFSSIIAIPSWQQGISMAANQGSSTTRNLPDVAMVADLIWVVSNGGQQGAVMGTSCAAPLWAAFTALVNQEAAANGAPPVGFLNPTIYAVGKSSGYANSFHDITIGNNATQLTPTRFFAASGYDLCTGWGSPKGEYLINSLVPRAAPAITSQPKSQIVGVGGNATFSVSGTGFPPPTYQWLFNGTPISGATLSTYARANVQAANAGNYRVVLANSSGSLTSVVAALTVVVPPSITANPQSQSIKVGSNVTFSVSASGTAPLNYRWWWVSSVGTTNTYPGWTNSSLTLFSIVAGSAGSFHAVVTNAGGLATSAAATLIVLTPPTITSQPQSQTVIVGDIVTFTVAVGGGLPPTYQWRFKGNPIPSATQSSYTMAGVTTNNAGNYSVVASNSLGQTNSAIGTLTVLVPFPGIYNTGVGDNRAVLADGQVDPHYKLILNPNDPSSSNAVVQDSTAYPIVGGPWVPNSIKSKWIGPALNTSGASSGNYTYQLAIDLTDYDPSTALLAGSWSADDSGSIYLNGVDTGFGSAYNGFSTFTLTNGFVAGTNLVEFRAFNGPRNWTGLRVENLRGTAQKETVTLTAPHVVTQPQNQTVIAGSPAIFNVLVIGTAPFDYLWWFNATSMPTETNANLSIGNAQPSSAGSYTVVVSNQGGSVTSTPALLAVNVPPSISAPPQTRTVTAGQSTTFSVAASGTAPLSYQWFRNNLALPGATTVSYAISATQPSDAGNYDVLVSNIAGVVDSGIAVLTVQFTPVINAQPQGQTVIVGDNVTFTVDAGGTLPLSYQWGFNGANIPTATGASLALTNVQLSQAGNYAVTVTSLVGSTNSSNALLTVNPLPPCVTPPPGLVSWWQAEGNATDIAGGVQGTVQGDVGFAPGKVGQALSFGGVDGLVLCQTTNALPENTFTIEFWAFPNAGRAETLESNSGISGIGGQRYAIAPTFQPGNDSGAGVSVGNNGISVFEHGDAYLPSLLVYSAPLTAWTHVAVVYENKQPSLYVNGTLVKTGQISPRSIVFASEEFGNPGNAGYGEYSGLLDEVSIYDRALAPSEIAAIYNAGSAGKCGLPPVILSPPQSQTVVTGATVTFDVTVAGTPPMSYQWHFAGADIADATSSSFTIAIASTHDAGNYSVTISNTVGQTSSIAAVLTVLVPFPGIYNTGVGDSRALLADGQVDPHYKLVVNPNNPASSDSIVQDSTAYPIAGGPWVPNSSTSKWIGPAFDTSAASPGTYSYQLTVDLTGYDPSTAFLAGSWSADDSGSIFLNGVDTGFGSAYNGFSTFTLTNGFVAGTNLVEFRAFNGPRNWTGLRVENLRGTVQEETVAFVGTLTISPAGSGIRVAWPISATGFVLQESISPLGNWANSPAAVVVQGTENVAVIATTRAATFYRLRK